MQLYFAVNVNIGRKIGIEIQKIDLEYQYNNTTLII